MTSIPTSFFMNCAWLFIWSIACAAAMSSLPVTVLPIGHCLPHFLNTLRFTTDTRSAPITPPLTPWRSLECRCKSPRTATVSATQRRPWNHTQLFKYHPAGLPRGGVWVPRGCS